MHLQSLFFFDIKTETDIHWKKIETLALHFVIYSFHSPCVTLNAIKCKISNDEIDLNGNQCVVRLYKRTWYIETYFYLFVLFETPQKKVEVGRLAQVGRVTATIHVHLFVSGLSIFLQPKTAVFQASHHQIEAQNALNRVGQRLKIGVFFKLFYFRMQTCFSHYFCPRTEERHL